MEYDTQKQIEDNEKISGQYKREGDDAMAHDFFIARRTELQEARRNVAGVNIETIWSAADNAYVPHQLSTGSEKVGYIDDELGWRGQAVAIGEGSDWQETSVSVNPYTKVQTALGIIIDKNPEAVFKATVKKFEQSTLLHKELYHRSWEVANSSQMLKTVVLNGAKYGVIAGMTTPLKIERKVRNIVSFYPGRQRSSRYEDKIQKFYDDVYRWALNPWTCWFDDMAKPGDIYSLNDWVRFKDFSWDRFTEMFGDFANYKYVVPSQISDTRDADDPNDKKPSFQKKDVVRLWFYENLEKDMYFVEDNNGVVLINEPIPHDPHNKRLSCWVAPWTLRNMDTLYGIGIYEAMRNDFKIYNKIRKMTVDQLLISIYKEWFYSGTNTLTNTGTMTTSPGVGRQVANPKDIVWNEIPGPGKDAIGFLEYFESKIDDSVGISKTLEGELSPNAKAFDIAQAREASLKRMKTPLDNVAFALEQDAYITVGLHQEMYSVPEVESVTDPERIMKIREEIAKGEIPNDTVFESSDGEREVLEVKKYKEVSLYIERDDAGELTQTKEERFFTIKPDDLPWDGKITILGTSIVPESPLLEKQTKLEFANMLIPMLGMDPAIALKPAKELCKVYEEDPEDWLPDHWLNPPQMVGMQPGMQPGMPSVGAQVAPQEQVILRGGQSPMSQAPEAQKVVPNTQINTNQQSVVGQAVQQLNPLK